MAQRTFYGIVEALGDEQVVKFRIHLANSVEDADVQLFQEDEEYRNHNEHHRKLGVWRYPMLSMVYSREVHVCKTEDRNHCPVLHIREGPRFMETALGRTFPYRLTGFLTAE